MAMTDNSNSTIGIKTTLFNEHNKLTLWLGNKAQKDAIPTNAAVT